MPYCLPTRPTGVLGATAAVLLAVASLTACGGGGENIANGSADAAESAPTTESAPTKASDTNGESTEDEPFSGEPEYFDPEGKTPPADLDGMKLERSELSPFDEGSYRYEALYSAQNGDDETRIVRFEMQTSSSTLFTYLKDFTDEEYVFTSGEWHCVEAESHLAANDSPTCAQIVPKYNLYLEVSSNADGFEPLVRLGDEIKDALL